MNKGIDEHVDAVSKKITNSYDWIMKEKNDEGKGRQAHSWNAQTTKTKNVCTM